MTDEQLLRRLAEIEGIQFTGRIMSGYLEIVHPEGGLEWWSPLANWSDLGPLIEKYIDLIQKLKAYEHGDPEEEWRVCPVGDSYGPSHASLPHAICLAIVKAYE